MAPRTTEFQYTGVYQGSSNNTGYRNQTVRYQMKLKSGTSSIPEEATIKNISFVVSAITIKKDADKVPLRIYEDDDNDIEYKNYNKTQDTKDILNVTPLTDTVEFYGSSKDTVETSVSFSDENTNQSNYFKNKNSFYIRIVRTNYTESGWLGFWVGTDIDITCTVEWEDTSNYQKPDYPTGLQLDKSSFTVTEATNGATATLEWDELSISSDASNKITGARIWYKEVNASTWSRVDEGDITKDTTSYPITVPRNKGNYFYVVQPLTDAGDSYTYTQADLFNNNAYARLTVSEIGNVTAPTSVWSSFGGLYLGESNKPSSFIINWSGAKGGTNNPIKSYQITCPDGDIYTINNPSATQYEINQSPNTGYYSIAVWGEKDTTATAITNVTLFNPLSRPATTTITTQPSGEIIESSFTVGWRAATRPADVNSIAYIVYQYRSGSWNWLTETDSTQIDLKSSNFTGENNYIGVVTRYYSSNGTYTDSSGMATTNALKYATEIPLPDPFWASHYDTTTSTLTGKAENVYNNIKLTWYAIKDDNYSSNIEFSYQVYRSVNGGTYTALTGALLTKGNIGGTLTYTDNDIKNYRNSQIKYYILITNKSTNKTVNSPDTPNINVIKEIAITNFEVAPGSNEITSTNMPIRFNWTSGLPVLSEGSGISASLYMTYNNTTTLVESWSNLQENDRNAIIPIDISLVDKQNSGDVFSQLYNRVITEGYPQPQVKLDLRLKYNAFSGSEISKEVSPVKLSYFTAPKIAASGQLTVKLPDDRNYYNPGETASVTLTGFSWTDAAGNSTSPATEVKNYLYDKSTKQKYELSTSNNSTTVQLPVTSATDMTLNLSLVTDIVYKGENITKQYELDRSCNIPIARWIAEAVTIRNVRRSERTNLEDWLEGQIIVPERYCGSDYYQNSSSIIPNLSSPIGNEISCVFTTDNTLNVPTVQNSFAPSVLIQDENQKPRIINFLFYSPSDLTNNYSNIKLNFTLKFKNTSTSNNTLTIDNILYRVLSAEVDFAVRKGKIGVNVSKDFGTSADKSNSVLELNTTKVSEDAIVKITSAGSFDNGKTKYISLFDSSGDELSIYTEGGKVFIDGLHIDMPEIDNTKLVSTDGEIIAELGEIEFEENIPSTYLLITNNLNEEASFALISSNSSASSSVLSYWKNGNIYEILTTDNLMSQFSDTSLVDMLNKDVVSAKKGHALVLGNNGVIETSVVTTEQLLTLSDMPSGTTVWTELNKKADIYNTIKLEEITSDNNENFGSLTFYYNEGASSSSILEIQRGILYINGVLVDNTSGNTGAIQATVYGGNGIRYGMTEPSGAGLKKGQIWLKPALIKGVYSFTNLGGTNNTNTQTYGFNEIVIDGEKWYRSTNMSASSADEAKYSYSLCKIQLDKLGTATGVNIVCKNIGEPNCDFGLISNIGQTLQTSYSVDSNVKYSFATAGANESTHTVSFSRSEIEAVSSTAQRFIQIKYRKDQSVNKANEGLTFKVEFVYS